jgi:hypothetical protein
VVNDGEIGVLAQELFLVGFNLDLLLVWLIRKRRI